MELASEFVRLQATSTQQDPDRTILLCGKSAAPGFYKFSYEDVNSKMRFLQTWANYLATTDQDSTHVAQIRKGILDIDETDKHGEGDFPGEGAGRGFSLCLPGPWPLDHLRLGGCRRSFGG